MQIAGNPDQQEDNLDEQYQEDGDDEVTKTTRTTSDIKHSDNRLFFNMMILWLQAQDEMMENQKREAGREEGGDPYNEENGEQVQMTDVKYSEIYFFMYLDEFSLFVALLF